MTIAKVLFVCAFCFVASVFGMRAARAEQASPLSGEVKKIDGSAVDLSKYRARSS
jgi:hypothetical protein